MGSSSTKIEQHGYEWEVCDQAAHGYFDKCVQNCSDVQSTLADLLDSSDLKNIFRKTSENVTQGITKFVANGGNILAVTSLVMSLTDQTTSSTEELLQNIQKKLEKMDKKLENIQKFQSAFQKGFLEGKYKNTFNYLLEYDERQDSKLLVDSQAHLTDFLSISSEVNKAVNCENKQYYFILSTLQNCWYIKGMLEGMAMRCKDVHDQKTLKRMYDNIIQFESLVKKLIWQIIQQRFKLMKVYTGYWKGNYDNKIAKLDYFFEDDVYSGCKTHKVDDAEKGSVHRDAILISMLKELLAQLGLLDNREETLKFLKEVSQHGRITLEFNKDWTIYGTTEGDYYYETYEMTESVQLSLEQLIKQL